jgi:hypothetical protein
LKASIGTGSSDAPACTNVLAAALREERALLRVRQREELA